MTPFRPRPTRRAIACDGSMRATIFDVPGNVTVEDRPRPEPGPGEVRLRVGGASLCASDVRVYRGEKYAKAGVIPGHEIAGVVDAVGDGVAGITRATASSSVRWSPVAVPLLPRRPAESLRRAQDTRLRPRWRLR